MAPPLDHCLLQPGAPSCAHRNAKSEERQAISRHGKLKAWSDLSEQERAWLLEEYQRALALDAPTCSFDLKVERMQHWLAQHGVAISEAEIRGKS